MHLYPAREHKNRFETYPRLSAGSAALKLSALKEVKRRRLLILIYTHPRPVSFLVFRLSAA